MEQLTAKGYPAESIDAVVNVLDQAEMARYTPDSSSHMDELYQQGVAAINNLEKR